MVWEGTVHVFDLEGHPETTRAHAWSSPIEGSDNRRFYAVLHLGGIRSPLDAVRAGIVAEHKAKQRRTRERLQRDIEGKLDSIRLSWAEMAGALSAEERAEVRRSIELHLADLKDLISN
jgi:hypothetical protein